MAEDIINDPDPDWHSFSGTIPVTDPEMEINN